MPKILDRPEESILSAARRIATEEGYAAATVRAVARECGIAVGTIYNYYPSKDTMLAACLLRDWQQTLAAAGESAASARSAEEAVKAVFSAILAFEEQNRRIFTDERARTSAAAMLQSRHAQLRGQIAALLEAPCRRFAGEEDDFLPAFVAESLLAWSVESVPFSRLWQQLCRLFPNG